MMLISPLIVDETASSEQAGGDGDGGAAGADHLGEELLGEGEPGRLVAVSDHKEPAGEALLDVVEAVAGAYLTDQQDLILEITKDRATKGVERKELLREAPEIHAEGGCVDLDEAFRGAHFGAEEMKGFGEAFVPIEANLHTVAVDHGGNDGGDAGGEEVNVAGRLVRLVEGLANGKDNGLRELQEPLFLLGREGFEDGVCVCIGHGDSL